jgi:UDP:flavonoid glycosyltransferase YjiC (YdhE family)
LVGHALDRSRLTGCTLTCIPQAQVLPHCRAVICHGGAATVLGALGHGRPLLVLPEAAEHFASGERSPPPARD